jgi:predicted metal-dependent hydrolase
MIGTEQVSNQLQSREERVVLAGRAMVSDAGCRIHKREVKQTERLTEACLIGDLSDRGQKTRWRSCSQKGNLSFNWKLIMMPEPVIDYVIVHELAHLKEMNHTKRFWELVGKHCLEWRYHRKWLKDHGVEFAATLFA